MIVYPAGVRDRITRVLESGTEGDAVVFCHGLAARADRWRHNLDVVANAGYHAYAYDHPGHGLATKGPDYDYTVPGFADFLESFLEFAGIEEAYLVGTSFGGATAGEFTTRHADRVKGLVLVGAVGLAPMPQETRQRIRDRIGDASLDGVKTKLTTLLIDASLATDDFVREEHMINSSPGAKEAFDRLGAYMAEDVERDIVVDRLAEVGERVPVLLLWGELDRTFPVSVAEEARAKIPGASLALVRGAGHAPYYEKAAAFNGVLRDFLAGRYGSFASDDIEYR